MSTAVLVMAYGTPPDRAGVLNFYTDVRRGRPPSDEQLAELHARYDAIGGLSPMNERTAAQISLLQQALDAIAPGHFRTYYGAKHTSPRIEDAVRQAALDGCTALVGVVLAPHYSALSVGEYVERARLTTVELGMAADFIEHWFDEPELIDALSTRVRDALASLSPSEAADARVVMTAHSLPERILAAADPYPAQIEETARLIASRLELESWRTGWQSAGRTDEAWLGPDINEIIRQLAAEGASAVVVCACGFTSDHLEVLYDLDILASSVANDVGIKFVRTASLNAEASVFGALATRVAERDEALAHSTAREAAPKP
jgi:ferrochelatase